MPRPTHEFNKYAQLGAEVRLGQLRDEIAAIYRAFPGLKFKKAGTASTAAASEHPEPAVDAPKPARRKRRKLTAAEKKLIGERMRKYWAARKAR